MEHNHSSRELKERGECPACDALYENADRAAATPVGEKAAAAAEYLLGVSPGPFSKTMIRAAAELFQASTASTYRMLGIHTRSKKLFTAVKNGEMTISEASRKAGYIEYNLGRNAPSKGIYFGKGDKFWQAIGPIHSYLSGWESRNYEFTNVAVKEAARRLAKIEQIIPMLEKARDDLVVRSEKTSLSVKDN